MPPLYAETGPGGPAVITITLNEAVTQNSYTGVFGLANGEPTPEEAWQLAEAFRTSDYMAGRTENALTVAGVQVSVTTDVQEPN
jgi:hypothetical protein